MSYIQIHNLYKSFGSNKVLTGIDLSVEKGKALVVIGRSGTGKSVLIKNLIGIIKPDFGNTIIDGVDFTLAKDKEKEEILSSCGFLFQGGALFDSLNIEENITFGSKKNITKKQKRDLAASKLLDVGLSDRLLDTYPSELSGGMMKRVALARAIFNDPKFIMFDEPTTGLDPIMSNVINDLIVEIRNKLQATTITITHDMNSVRQIATDIVMIEGGKIIWQGSKAEMDSTDNPYISQFIHGKTEGPINFN
jgi:phospholipid/cholesterol/gamma-HCH transport system ATP-binding protein